ncbi:polysaccharide lyase family 7 protein [Microvirga arsenatis]|uniref:Alginate lyase 2 domain-containing protein n=1 Tax=Microvirga arsenatis TaxID=2692265 RepID=A0ABW9YYB1_9HYPH|nr:polysaccharide lyase family 7 protein [Microvirga arsenatis]NBJ11116.1 hypothetical protein [Microvirga arsenatis]NBJ25389.1 hypothetical protein [Microvirga arsenatis]
MPLDPRAAPSRNFNLANWKIGLPIDTGGGFAGRAIEVKNLSGYKHSKYFFTGPDGAMTFVAPVEGATTSGSSYARSELREMKGTAKAAWTLAQGGVMSATLEIDHAPIKFNGKPGRIVVGQIHGKDDELVRLYWENGKLYFANDQAGSNNTEQKFYFVNASGQQPSVSLDERFSYTINAKGDNLEVTVYADGQIYKSVSKINSVWQSDAFYFKAGAYLGVNETQGTGYGQVSFYALSFSHSAKAISQKSGAAPIKGDAGKNILNGKASPDIFYSGYGNDVLHGGGGKDVFVFDTKLGTSKTDRSVNFDRIQDFSAGSDSIWLDDRIFTALGKGKPSQPAPLKKDLFVDGLRAKDKNDYVLYDRKTGILAYDPDGSGSKGAIEFARLKAGTLLTHKDLFIV